MKLKITFFILLVVCGILSMGYSQTDSPFGNSGTFTGGLGMAVIEGESYFTINLHPDISIGKFGVGLNVNLLYNTESGALRHEDWDEDYDWFRLIRYLRYGHKRDPFYARVGTLDAARLGHGFIMNYYTNEANYDNRKIGLAFDIDFGIGGFETVTSNLGRMEIIGIRGYARPLRPYLTIPIIKNIAIGATYATDVDPDQSKDSDDGVSVFGFDVEVPLLKFPMFNSFAYYDWAKINNFGSGQAVGLEANLTLIMDVASVTARVERRWLGTEFLPSYFNALYERDRYVPLEGGGYARKDSSLLLITEETKGIFGELVGNVLNTFRIVGNFQRLDEQKHSGVLHLAAEVPDAVPKIAAYAFYDRVYIEKGSDLFKLDENSIARVGIGYKVKPYLLVNMDYIYTFVLNEEKHKYETQKRFSPRISFVYPFNF